MLSGHSSASTDYPKAASEPVPSEYLLLGSVQAAGDNSLPKETKNGDDDTMSVDPTYEMVVNSQPEFPKGTSVKNVGAVCDKPSLADEENVDSSSENDDDEDVLEDPTYDLVLVNQSEAPKQTSAMKVDDVYDEPSMGETTDAVGFYDTVQDRKAEKSPVVEPPPLPMRPDSLSVEKPEAESKNLPIGVYAEVGLVGGESSEGNDEAPEEKGEAREGESEGEIKETKTLPVYAQVRRSSKRKLNPAMMDIGEVSADVEVETAEGSEALKMGMTKPIGDRFVFEELKEILHKYDVEDKNNMNERSEAKLDDFDVDQAESAFDTLKRFLQKHEWFFKICIIRS